VLESPEPSLQPPGAPKKPIDIRKLLKQIPTYDDSTFELYSLIVSELPEAHVKNRHSIEFRHEGKRLVVSIMDYLYYLRNQKKPPSRIYKLHKFVIHTFAMPICLVRNNYLRAM
jgi:hypothetical protein